MKMKRTASRKLLVFPTKPLLARSGFARVLLAAVLLALAVLALTGCKKKQTPAAMNAQADQQTATIDTNGSGSFGGAGWAAQRASNEKNISVDAGNSFAHITYKPAVKIIDKAAVDASLQGISTDGHGAVFKNASAEIRALKAGDIFLVKNAFACKILAAQTEGSQTVIIVDRAMLTDVVANGEINVDSPIGFHGPSVASDSPPPPPPSSWMDLIETPVYAQGKGFDPERSQFSADPGKNVTGQGTSMLISGWKIDSYSITPGANQATFSARLMKDTSGFKSAISMDGNITNFQFVSNINFSPSSAKQIMNGVKGMSGKMHFIWEIGKDTPGVWAQEDQLALPIGTSIPLSGVLEGLPLSLNLSAAFLIHPALTGGNEYSKGGFTIQWVGSASTQAQTADSGDEGLTFTIDPDLNISPVAPTGMVLSVCVPRIELALGLLGAYGSSTYMQVAAVEIDTIVDAVASHLLSPSVYAALKVSPLGSLTATNILGSKADVYVQVIHTDGVTHSPNVTLAPCTKTELKITAQTGGDANLLGLTGKAKTVTDIYTHTFTKWDPGSSFCKSI
jgi:hypothetical protein